MPKPVASIVLLAFAFPVFAEGTTWQPPVYWPQPSQVESRKFLSPSVSATTRETDSAKDRLFEKMAPWVYVETYRDTRNRLVWAKFLNTTTKRKTGWLRAGQFLEGARISSIDSDKAVLTYGGARQDLLFVPEEPIQPKKKNHQRTPEETAAAQRRYSEFYMKRFMLLGREYNRQRGMPSTVDPHGSAGKK
ncbi:MAG: hypothetical protein IT195_13550 [Microthrixaceae bacterium]|nr:hypothetical protein [Microthrixaceae bacterium]